MVENGLGAGFGKKMKKTEKPMKHLKKIKSKETTQGTDTKEGGGDCAIV